MKFYYIIFIFLLKIVLSQKKTKTRKLISVDEKENYCLKTKNIKFEKNYSSLNEYVESLNIKKNNGRPFLIELILNNKVNHLGNFSGDIGLYIFNICLSIVLLIGKNII